MTYISGEYYTVNVSINVLFGYSYVVYSCVVRVCVYSPKLSGRR
jgi:hypothetical protein